MHPLRNLAVVITLACAATACSGSRSSGDDPSNPTADNTSGPLTDTGTDVANTSALDPTGSFVDGDSNPELLTGSIGASPPDPGPNSETGAGAGSDAGGDGVPDSNPDTDDGSEPATGTTAGTTLRDCTVVDVINTGSGSQKIIIPLEPGQRLVLDQTPRGTLVGFDETLGELQYAPPVGRHPDFFTYQILDASDAIVSRGRMDIRLDPIRVLPLGDSITHGVEVGTGEQDSPPVPLRVGYRLSLLQQLAGAGQMVDFTGQSGQLAGQDTTIPDADNNGVPGVDISFINGSLMGILTDAASDVVLLHIGTNQTPADASGIEAILDTLDAWESTNFPVTALVATIIIKRDPGLQQQVDAFNADLRTRIQARSMTDRVVLVEQASAVTLADIDPTDVGVHPTAPGYLAMADIWFDAMRATELFPDCE